MFSCFACDENFMNNRLLLRHVKDIHSELRVFRCNERTCKRSFSIFRSFSRHRYHIHKFANTFPKIDMSTGNDLNIFSEPNRDDSLADTHEFSDSASSSLEFSDSESEETHYQMDGHNYQSASNKTEYFTNNGDDYSIGKEVLRLYARLYNFHGIPRKKIDEIISMFGQFTKLMLDDFKKRVDNEFQSNPALVEVEKCTRQVIDDLSFILNGMQSEHLRFKAFEKCGTYVTPETVQIGERKEFQVKNDNVIYKMIPMTMEFIPIRKVLEKFFGLEEMLNETLTFMDQLKNDHCHIIQNFIQGSLWKQKEKLFDGKIVIPLFLYFDEYEPNNPIGSHKGLNKCGAIYITVGTLPDKYRSKLQNIFLLQLFNPLDKKSVPKHVIFNRVITELQYLEQHGLTIADSTGSKQIYFSLSLITGDNLGLHWMLGFQENFSSNFFCRFCMTHYSRINTVFHEDDCTLRNIDNYRDHIETKNLSLTGIAEECIFHQLSEYHVLNNLYVDISHDLLEGILRYDMAYIIEYFIACKFFSLAQFNTIIRAFRYDYNCKNKPVEIAHSHLENRYIIMTASEMLTLVTYLSLMIGHLVPPDDYVWELFLSLKRVTDICTSHKITRDTPALLEIEIHEYLVLRHQLFPNCFKPKHHFLIHYSRIMKLVGPLANISSIRDEGKHQEGKQASRAANSRKNINHSIAIRHQLKLNFNFLSQVHIQSEFSIGPYSSKNYTIPSVMLTNDVTFSNFKVLKWVKRQEYLIKNGTVLILFECDGTSFYQVELCCHCQQSGKILFATKKLDCVHFDEHYDAYKILRDDSFDWRIFTTTGIGAGQAIITYKVKLNDNNYYIPKRYV